MVHFNYHTSRNAKKIPCTYRHILNKDFLRRPDALKYPVQLKISNFIHITGFTSIILSHQNTRRQRMGGAVNEPQATWLS